MSGTGLGWPALVPPYRNRLEEWFSTPEKLYASFDTREELVSLLRACDNTLLESSLQLIADALLEWHADNARTVASGRREARRRLTECLPSVPGTGLSLHEHYNQIALQSPLALLPVLRKRKLATDRVVDRGARATEEIRLRQEYALRLAAIMQEAQLPVCKVLAGVSNAEEAWPRLFGTRRSKTLRNRFRAWDKFREWLLYSRGRSYPEGVADVLDYANERFQEGCGKTVLESLQASLSVIEGVGRVPSTQQISQDPTWQAQLKSYTADLVSAAPPEQPASMLTVAIILACEIFVCTPGEPSYLRALGFVCLLMVWGSLRADDVQGLLPQTMLLDERGLSIDLARSKTTGPDKRTHTVKVFVERSISLTGHDWLKVGYALWKDFDFERDYLVLKANEGFTEPLEKSVPSSTVALYFRKVLSELKTPKREGRTWKANDQRPLLPGYTSSHFTGHSARNFLSSVGAAIDVDPRELDYLGRWKVGGEGSATYIRTSRQVVHRLQSHIACSLVTGQPKHYIEVDSIKALTDYAAKAGESESQVRRRHTLLEGSKGLGGSWPTLALEVGVAAPPSPVEQVSMPGSRGDYFIVTSRTTGLRRLHMLGCYVKPENCYDVKFVNHVGAEDVDNICKDCKARMKAQAGEEESDPSSSDSGSESMRFQAIADSRPEARAAGKADFGFDDGAAEGRQQIAGVVAAWELARDVISKETETRAEAKVLGQPRILQVTERQAMLKAVAAVHGQLGESETPSSEYLALKCEECEANEPQASTLDAITSKKNTLTTSIQSSLDASGRIHITQHKSKSELPTTTEAYRKVLRVEAFTWLCMASRFKSKQWLQDLKLSDFDHFVNYILGEKVAQLTVPTSHQPADETYFTTPLALSIIERPRKWHKGDVGSYLQSLGNVTNLLQFDLQRSTEHDLTKEGLWQHIFQLLGEGDWILIVEQANYFLDQTVTACQLAWQYVLEHPEDLGATPDHELPASIWQLPALRELQVSTQAITFAFFQCSFEAPTSKPTRLLTNLQAFVEQPPPFASWPRFDSSDRYVGPLPPRCPRGKHDKVLAGREGSRWATESSAAYPPLLCEWLAHAVLASASQGGLGSAPHSSVPGEAGPMQESHEATQEVHQDLCEVPQGLHQVVSDRVEAVTDRVEAVGLIESEAPPSTLLPSPDSSGSACKGFPASTEALASFVRSNMPGHPFTTISLYLNTGTKPHKDSRNAPLPNGIIGVTDFVGGEIWVEAQDGESVQIVDGKRLSGHLLPISETPTYIHAYRDLHLTMPWKGKRLVIIAFSVSEHTQACDEDLAFLRGHGFVLPGEEHSADLEAVQSDDSEVLEGGEVERPEPFKHQECHNIGLPLNLEWDGKTQPITDGFGLCSPTRWPPEARGGLLPKQALEFATAMHQVLRDFVADVVPDIRRTAMELALGRLKESPFTPEMLRVLRKEWFSCIEAASGGKCTDLDVVPSGQPFFLHAVSATARLLQDPDWKAVSCQEDSYVSGVAIGYDCPAPHLPQVYEYKHKSRKLDESDVEWHRENYSSANETSDQLEKKFAEEEALGRMAPSTLPVLEQKYGRDRVRIASLGSLIKPDGSARPLHDGTHGVHVNNGIRLLNQQSNPGPQEVVHLVRSAKQSQEATFCLTGDVTAAHRLFLVREADWPLLCCKVRNDTPVVWYNKVGTFGISSSAFLWSRLFGIIGRCTARFLLTLWFYHLVFVDDVHANFAGREKFHHLLMWLACFEMFGTPFAYKKFRGGLTSAFVGYELSYPDQRVGISESRGQWLLKWIAEARSSKFVVSVRRFAEFLGRLGFVARLLVWLKAHLAPLYSWRAAVNDSSVARMPDTVILTLEYLDLTFRDMTFKVAAARSVKRAGVAFRTDAKCADGYVVLGGWDCAGTTQESRWFSLRLTPSEAPYLFDSEGHSQWASASAELLATLAALHIFGHLEAGPTRRLMKVEVLAQTDNKSNEGLTRKGSTTRWPLLMVNMQLTHVLMKAGLRLNLGWRPRDENQEADDLTNEIFDRFSEELRVPVQYSELPLSFLHTLYEARRAQLSSREVDSIRDTVGGRPRFRGKRKREKSPW
ncbi:FCPC [Symbiodinium sp. CCMP2592]|nr:FCPC [Symbiodinium sp. CCMP2592]